MTYSSSFSTKKVLNLSISSSNKLRKSISSLEILSLALLSSPATVDSSNLGRLLGRSPALLGSTSFNLFLRSLQERNLSRHSGKVSSIWLLRLLPNFIFVCRENKRGKMRADKGERGRYNDKRRIFGRLVLEYLFIL